MAKIALVTDSTADLTKEMITSCNAHVVSLGVNFADATFAADQITSEEFYQRLNEATDLPTTSQPTPEDFVTLYERLLDTYDEVISIHLSTALSGTLGAAHIASEKLREKIHLVDSKSISLGVGLMVTEAARCIKEGLSVSAILDKINIVRQNTEVLFTVNTLEYLQKGGRIGKVSGMVGTLLNIKPIIRVSEEGIYVPAGKARSQSKALDSMVNTFQQLANGRQPLSLAVAHGAALEAAKRLQEAMEIAFSMPVSIFTQVGPVIGVHTGPGTVGAAIQFKA